MRLDFNIVLAVFLIGYLAIVFEHYIKINKTASAILMAVFTWIFLFAAKDRLSGFELGAIQDHISDASQIIFFLLGAMTLVELIDSHNGFKIITNMITTKSKKKLFWIIAIFSFFLSSFLDNLTTTIVMISLLRKLIEDKNERIFAGALVVVAANAGGAWTPIGDVTTTMLWIKGHISSLAIMKSLFLPSLFSLIVTTWILCLEVKGKWEITGKKEVDVKTEPGAKIVLLLGILALIFVPFFRYMTGLPPFMGMFIGLGVLWIVTDIMHSRYEARRYLRIPHILTKVDMSGILFFLGILLAINSLEMIGFLKKTAVWLNVHVGNLAVISVIIGLLSSIVDNVPLVAACMGMYDLSAYPMDSSLWIMIAYAAGAGGSILLIGSAAGVALMGLEKVDFIWYAKKVTLAVLAGYLAGFVLYLFLNAFLF